MPKPTSTAIEEFLDGKLRHRMRDAGVEEVKAD
jgi:DNA-directed RNA polymerase subunit K/omega